MAAPLFSQVWVREFQTSEVVQCGKVTTTQAIELGYLRILLFKHGTLAGTEQVRAKVYHDSGYTQLYATSDWADIADIDGLTTDWWGWLRLDFDRPNLAAGSYYIALETTGYTYSDSAYLAASLNWPLAQYTQVDTQQFSVMLQIYGYRDLL